MKRNIIIAFFLLFSAIAVFCFLTQGPINTLPPKKEVKAVSLKLAEDQGLTTDSEVVAALLEDMKVARKTIRAGNADQPPADSYITIIFTKSDNDSDTFYFYRLEGRYYIEKPYEGVYVSTQSVEETLEFYLHFLVNEQYFLLCSRIHVTTFTRTKVPRWNRTGGFSCFEFYVNCDNMAVYFTHNGCFITCISKSIDYSNPIMNDI